MGGQAVRLRERCRVIPDAVLDALAVLLPVECAGCGAPDRAVCARCRAHLLSDVVAHRIGELDVHTALRYEGVVRAVVLALKEEGRTDSARALAGGLRAAIARAAGGRPVELVPVPTSRAAWRRRGYDPVRLLVRRAGLRARPLLVHRGGAARQKSLGSAGRAENRAGAFAAITPLHGRDFVIVDDVVTTGATVREAARAIHAAGGRVVGAAALAYTPRIRPAP